MERKNKGRYWAVIPVAAMAVFYFWMAAQIPYTHDDWDWGLPVGITQLITANINSRYAGNFLEVVMTRSVLLKNAIMGLVFVGLPLLMTMLAAKDSEEKDGTRFCIVFLTVNALILGMDVTIWRQTYGWVAGFANFSVSALFMCIYFYTVWPVFSRKEELKKGSKLAWVGGFCLGVVMQLFLENVAICMVVVSGAVAVLSWTRSRRILPIPWLTFAGCLVGIAIMFSSSIYGMLWDSGAAVDGYRELSFATDQSLGQMIGSCYEHFRDVLSVMLWEDNRDSYILVAALMTALVLFRKQQMPKGLKAVLVLMNMGVIFWYHLVIEKEYLQGMLMSTGRWKDIRFLMNVGVFLVTAVQIILIFRKDGWKMWKFLLVFVSIPLVIAPLAATTETGPRLFFTPNVLLAVFIALVLWEVLEQAQNQLKGLLLVAAVTIILINCFEYWSIYRPIGAVARQREQIIAQAVEAGEKTITIPKYPYDKYLWLPNPTDENRVVFFKDFYEIPRDTTLIFE